MEVCAWRAPKCLLEMLALCLFYFLVLNEQRDSKIWPLIVEGQWNIHNHWCSSFQSLMNYHLLPFNHNFSQKRFFPLVSRGDS